MGVAVSLSLKLRSQLDLMLRNRASQLSWKPQPNEQTRLPRAQHIVFVSIKKKMVLVACVLSKGLLLLSYTGLKVGVGMGAET